MINYVENKTDNWVPVTASISPGNSSWPPVIPDGNPPSRVAGGPVPPHHELRPGERYYWADKLPEPPPSDDPKWDAVRRFLLAFHPRTNDAVNKFGNNVWKDRAAGDTELKSAGAWAQDFDTLYWNPPWADVCPEYRSVGWEPWANGHPGGNHYCSATWALEEYLISGDPLAWQLFSLRVLHLAGQGLDWRYGGIRYEKSSWCFAGDFQQDGYFLWSHMWPEAVLLYNYLTGELDDAKNLLVDYGFQNPHNWTGYWGIRGSGWYLRAIRCAYELTQDDGVRVFGQQYIDKILTTNESFGKPYFPNKGAYDDSISPWQQWLFLSEILAFAFSTGDNDVYDRIKPILDWLLDNTRFDDGSIAYLWSPTQGKKYLSFVHTSYALPAMSYMAERGDFSWDEVKKSTEFVINGLPEANGHEGLLWLDSKGRQTRPWGPAAPKIAANAMYGLRPTVLHQAGV